MYLKLFLIFFYIVISETQVLYEGDQCFQRGVAGVCKNLNACNSAIEGIKNRKNPQVCSFSSTDPVVCCFDKRTTVLKPVPVTTTTGRSEVEMRVEDGPTQIDKDENQCEEIPPSFTSKKTGQKAFDKCIEYQEKYVLPCDRSSGFVVEPSRGNNCYHNAVELITGGTDAAIFEFPHMVMLGYGEDINNLQWLCGGAIISERFVLTAGHCISNRDNLTVTHVLIGALRRSDAADKSKIYKVKNVIKHPEYLPPVAYNDITLLETEKPMKLDQFTVPACLHTGDAVDEDRVLATGWGFTRYTGRPSPAETLQKVILNKFSTEECIWKYRSVRLMKDGFNEKSQTCYGDKQTSKDTCYGDSGGPIQIKSKKIYCMYTIVGVTSYALACGFVGEPGIYTRVANYVPWIESIVWP